MEIKTVHKQYATIIKTLRGICNKVPEIRGIFDNAYRESLVSFDMDTFLSRGCTFISADYDRAVEKACEAVREHISSLDSNTVTIDHQSILFQLTSEMVTVALDGLKIARPVTVLRSEVPTQQPRRDSKASSSSSQPARKEPPKNITDAEISHALQGIETERVHYLGCPNLTKKCHTCVSAFKLLDITPCSHKGEWCTRVGYYPHFPRRLQRKYSEQHSSNLALTAADFTEPEAPEQVSESAVSSREPSPQPAQTWSDEVEEAAALEQALIADQQVEQMECASTSSPRRSERAAERPRTRATAPAKKRGKSVGSGKGAVTKQLKRA